jgi:hypothetical protein
MYSDLDTTETRAASFTLQPTLKLGKFLELVKTFIGPSSARFLLAKLSHACA